MSELAPMLDRIPPQAVEAEQARERARSGRNVLGRYAVLRQSWRESPTSREPRRNLRPTVAARSLWTRLEAIQRKREFAAAYREARRLNPWSYFALSGSYEVARELDDSAAARHFRDRLCRLGAQYCPREGRPRSKGRASVGG